MQQSEFFAHLDELLEVKAGTVVASTPFKDHENWSSLTMVVLMALIDEEYGLSLAPTAIMSCQTAGDLAECVASGLQRRAAA